jgi:hypothetical protein
MNRAQEHDLTKRMIQQMNFYNKPRRKSLIRENSENTPNELIITDDPKFGQETLTTQKQNLINGLNSNISFKEDALIYYPNEKDLTFTGEINDMSNLRFQFRLNDPSGNGCYIWVTGLQMSDDNLKKINLIKSLFLNWKDYWVKNSKLLDSFVEQTN